MADKEKKEGKALVKSWKEKQEQLQYQIGEWEKKRQQASQSLTQSMDAIKELAGRFNQLQELIMEAETPAKEEKNDA